MASTAVASRSSASKKGAKAAPFELISEVDDDGYYRAKVFGEEFEFDSQVNGMLVLFAGSGRSEDVVRLVESVLRVTPQGKETFDQARSRIRTAFLDTVGRQRDFGIENAIELINEMTEAAGKDLSE